jgi:hypothetical protein
MRGIVAWQRGCVAEQARMVSWGRDQRRGEEHGWGRFVCAADLQSSLFEVRFHEAHNLVLEARHPRHGLLNLTLDLLGWYEDRGQGDKVMRNPAREFELRGQGSDQTSPKAKPPDLKTPTNRGNSPRGPRPSWRP